jgi:hypothetical protein
MKTYIPKQPKQTRERIEAKLDANLVRMLERYCEFLDSDRDYVVSQALEIVFHKDKGFAEWIAAHPTAITTPSQNHRRPRRKENNSGAAAPDPGSVRDTKPAL